MFYIFCKCRYPTCVIILIPGTIDYLTKNSTTRQNTRVVGQGEFTKIPKQYRILPLLLIYWQNMKASPITGDTVHFGKGFKEIILVLTWKSPPTVFALIESGSVSQAAKEDKQLILLYSYKF